SMRAAGQAELLAGGTSGAETESQRKSLDSPVGAQNNRSSQERFLLTFLTSLGPVLAIVLSPFITTGFNYKVRL
ncbi:hypothetical protein XENOCAPTIV_019091, partial [Xenoophorus captivus]